MISDRYRFLYVANLRTASNSIHTALRSVASYAVDDTSAGKHQSLCEIYDQFGSDRIDPLFKWAVIRNPVEYLASLYEMHQRPAFAGLPHSTAGLTFEEFYQGDTHAWMRVPQSSRFRHPDGGFGLDLLITMDHLSEGFAYLKFRLGLPNLLLPHQNRTDAEVDLPASLRGEILDTYAEDIDCIEEFGDRERTANGLHHILSPLDVAPAWSP